MKIFSKLFKKKTDMDKLEALQCPVCGYHCLGNGGVGCIDKKSMYLILLEKESKNE